MADLATINADIDSLDAENNTQAAKIAEAMSLLNTKAAGGKNEPLTFSGAVSAVYDGSEPVSVEIPQGGGDEWEFIGEFTSEDKVASSFYVDFGKPLKKWYALCETGSNKLCNTSQFYRCGSTRTLYNTEYYCSSSQAAYSTQTWVTLQILVDMTIFDKPAGRCGTTSGPEQLTRIGPYNGNAEPKSGCWIGIANLYDKLNASTWKVFGVPA